MSVARPLFYKEAAEKNSEYVAPTLTGQYKKQGQVLYDDLGKADLERTYCIVLYAMVWYYLINTYLQNTFLRVRSRT